MIASKDEIVKDEIVKQAQILFQQFGLKKTTMDEIAEACGKAKSTLYHYFKSKEDVFDAVVQMEMTSLRILVKSYVDDKKSLKDKLMTYFIKFHEEILNKVNIYRIVKHELRNENHAKEYFLRMLEFEKSYVTRMLEDGIDAKEFNGVEPKDVSWFAETILAAFFGIVRFSIESDQGFDQEKLEKIAGILIPKIFG